MQAFYCERTAEYALVPLIRDCLLTKYSTAVPIYFWKSREGNSLSSQMHSDRHVRLVAFFARRLKFDKELAFEGGRINQHLFEFGNQAANHGIFTFAGLPLASTLIELHERPAVLWFSLVNEIESDIKLRIRQRGASIDISPPTLTVLSLAQILEETARLSEVLTWRQAIQRIGMLGGVTSARTRSFFGFGGYKPLYFALFED